MASSILVIVAEDHTVVRQGLLMLLAAAGNIQVVGEAENGAEAVQLARRLRPDIAILDIGLPIMDGLTATARIRQTSPETRIIILTACDSDETVERAMEAGASGFVTKRDAAEHLLAAIGGVYRGGKCIGPAVLQRLIARKREAGRLGATSKLTLREQQVLQLISAGASNRSIGGELGISYKTVEKHRMRLMKKLHIHDIAGLTRYALETMNATGYERV